VGVALLAGLPPLSAGEGASYVPLGLASAVEADQDSHVASGSPTLGTVATLEALDPLLEDLARQATEAVEQGDLQAALSAVAPYPEGGAFLVIHEPHEADDLEVDIPSKAAAFFIIGVQAVVNDQNRVVARWCFLEAARRNPSQPEYLNNAAFLLLEFDQVEEARTILEPLTQVSPDFPAAQVNLGVAYTEKGEHEKAATRFLTAFKSETRNLDPLRMAKKAADKAGTDSEIVREVRQYADTLLSDEESDSDEGPGGTSSTAGSCTVGGYRLAICQQPRGERRFDSMYEDGPKKEIRRDVRSFRDQAAGLKEEFMTTMVEEHEVWARCVEDALSARDACRSKCADQSCTAYCDRCIGDIKQAECPVKEWKRVRGEAMRRSDLTLREVRLLQGKLMSIAQTSASQFPENWMMFLGCNIDNEVAAGSCDEYVGAMGAAVYWEAITTRNLNQAEERLAIAHSYCEGTSRPVAWLITGEPILSMGNELCLIVLCIGHNASGDLSISLKAVVAVEFSFNPMTDSWSLGVGAGWQTGVGYDTTIGASAMIKWSSEGGLSIEPTFSLGPLQGGYELTFSNTSAV
jgi:tetratricopeptide (TPR) repeat protein